ncbi:delta-class carbonic anhydrase [Aliiglaciecola sp. LCG003]|uniref:delta-class carbonic anhydrase n=1 Tax=Aliiglaciecola sp. LCG003 TaxID=3053655 RepID=UPI0033657C6E
MSHSSDENAVEKQRAMLQKNTHNKGFGPQSPRDIDAVSGNNKRIFSAAPDYTQMNLCNIHFHKSAEHKGGEFSKDAGNGTLVGFDYSGQLSQAEIAPISQPVCQKGHSSLSPGDTIEVHYVHSSAQVKPGHTLKACLSESFINPQLRVETQVYVVVNDQQAGDFGKLTDFELKDGLYQSKNIPNDTGTPIEYAGSTTGPDYNEKASPIQVTWSVRPQVAKVNIESVGNWCEGNEFKEDHAHGVRNLVINPDLLSVIE